MFKRFVNNQALLNGLKQIKRSDNNEQQQIVIAGNPSTGIIVPLSATPNTKVGIELQDFCNTLVPTDSAIFKIAKQICEEQGSRIKQIAIEVLKDSGLNTTNINNNSSNSSNNTKNNSSLVKTSSSIPSLTHNGQPSVIISEETKTPTKPMVKTHGKFYGTNKMFLLDEEEIVNISGIPSSTPPIISNNMETSDTIPSTQTSQSLNLDIVKRLLSDIFGKLKYLAMVLLNSLFGNRQSVQSDAATTQVAAQSLVLVISFMIYNIVAESSSADLHHDILQVFQEYLSNHLNN